MTLDDPKAVDQALEHFAKDPVLGPLVNSCPRPEYKQTTDPFLSLSRAVVYQQLSGKAASTIWGRLETLAGGTVTPETILPLSIEDMRGVGCSRPKASYLHDIALRFAEERIHPHLWPDMAEDQVREEIKACKGLGDWSADMFLMFSLCRPDVWPVGDQGIRNAAKSLLNREAHLPLSELESLAEPWRPYRTVAAHYLWRSLEIITPD